MSDLLPSTLNGRYRVLRELGRGGMGRVLLVEDSHRNNLQLALKTLQSRHDDQWFLKSFRVEFSELAKLGYAEVEFAGYNQGPALPPITVPEIRRLLDRYGLRGVGSHIGLTQFRDNLTRVLDDAQTLGLSYVGTANAPDALFPAASAALHVTVVVPSGKVLPEAGLHVTATATSTSSVAVTE